MPNENGPKHTTEPLFIAPPAVELPIVIVPESGTLSKKALRRQRERIAKAEIAAGIRPDSPIPTQRIARRRDE